MRKTTIRGRHLPFTRFSLASPSRARDHALPIIAIVPPRNKLARRARLSGA